MWIYRRLQIRTKDVNETGNMQRNSFNRKHVLRADGVRIGDSWEIARWLGGQAQDVCMKGNVSLFNLIKFKNNQHMLRWAWALLSKQGIGYVNGSNTQNNCHVVNQIQLINE